MAARRTVDNAHPAWGWFCIVLGFYPLALARGWIPDEPDPANAPPWVMALVGIVFIGAGCLILLRGRSRFQHLFAAIITGALALVGLWAALLSSDDGFSGGLFFLSRETNVTPGRWMFGLGALITLAIFVWALYLFNRGDD